MLMDFLSLGQFGYLDCWCSTLPLFVAHGEFMDARLRKLIDEYVASVEVAVDALNSMGVPKPASNNEWAMFQLPDDLVAPTGTRIFKHGYGCRFKNELVDVDFDFGEYGEIDGFDCWRLYDFCLKNPTKTLGFDSQSELEVAFEEACDAEELIYSGYLLWYDRQTHQQHP